MTFLNPTVCTWGVHLGEEKTEHWENWMYTEDSSLLETYALAIDKRVSTFQRIAVR